MKKNGRMTNDAESVQKGGSIMKNFKGGVTWEFFRQ